MSWHWEDVSTSSDGVGELLYPNHHHHHHHLCEHGFSIKGSIGFCTRLDKLKDWRQAEDGKGALSLLARSLCIMFRLVFSVLILHCMDDAC